ncbi:MAG: hypothetical protein GX272_05135 [Epulopiscium sp.]|nr:hypothetical protein [Candidatus Epulonipiscium sp.]
MLDIVFEVVDIILNFIIEDAVEEATNKKAKANLRYILFSALCAVLTIAFGAMIVYTFKKGDFVISFLFFVVSAVVMVCWFRVRYLKSRRKSSDK